MLKELKKSPEPLQRQIILRFGLSIVFSILLVALLISTSDIYIILPIAGTVVFLSVNTVLLIYHTLNKKYIIISGICTAVNVARLKKKPKTVQIAVGEQTIAILLSNRRRAVTVGSQIELYVLSSSPIYEKDGMQMLYTYLALSVTSSQSKH